MHGGNIYVNTVDLDFSVCLNPLGMPPEAAEAAVRGILEEDCYPDPASTGLRKSIARFLGKGLLPEHIFPGNGACELIYTLASALLAPGDKVSFPSPAFSEYGRASRAFGAHTLPICCAEEDGFAFPEGNAAEILESGIKILFLCNPNNPTGTVISTEVLRRLADRAGSTGAYLVVDESFLPFSMRERELTALSLAREFPHVVVLRAFTKIFAMAGLRLGCLISSDAELLREMKRRTQPWNVSVPAQRAGAAALRTGKDYLDETRLFVRDEKNWLRSELPAAGAGRIFGEDGNYLLFTARPDLKECLLRKGILIRSFDEEEGLPPDYFRIGIRKRPDNERLIRAMRETEG